MGKYVDATPLGLKNNTKIQILKSVGGHMYLKDSKAIPDKPFIIYGSSEHGGPYTLGFSVEDGHISFNGLLNLSEIKDTIKNKNKYIEDCRNRLKIIPGQLDSIDYDYKILTELKQQNDTVLERLLSVQKQLKELESEEKQLIAEQKKYKQLEKLSCQRTHNFESELKHLTNSKIALEKELEICKDIAEKPDVNLKYYDTDK